MKKKLGGVLLFCAVVLLSSFKTNSNINNNNVNCELKENNPIIDSTKVFQNKDFLIQNTIKKPVKKKFAITANYGYSYRLSETDKSLNNVEKQHINNLKSGYSYDISAYYMHLSTLGFGIKYNVHNSQTTTNNLVFTDSNNNQSFGIISNNVSIGFVGPSYIVKTPANKIGEAYLEMALGYMFYANDYVYDTIRAKDTGGNLGLTLGFGYNFQVRPNFLIGPQVNFATSTLSALQVENKNNGEKERIALRDENKLGLLRVDLSVGATFRF